MAGERIRAPIDTMFPLLIGVRPRPSPVANVQEDESHAARPLPHHSYDSRNDLETIWRAQEILRDADRLAAAKTEAARQSDSYNRLARLKGKII